ncbi:MAG: hypothetical protein EHM57_08235 [Actinobacteria bacterium]|nr:MAG: hypothetical protein EHM57_08235 [Actinomycetota bacterium]
MPGPVACRARPRCRRRSSPPRRSPPRWSRTPPLPPAATPGSPAPPPRRPPPGRRTTPCSPAAIAAAPAATATGRGGLPCWRRRRRCLVEWHFGVVVDTEHRQEAKRAVDDGGGPLQGRDRGQGAVDGVRDVFGEDGGRGLDQVGRLPQRQRGLRGPRGRGRQCVGHLAGRVPGDGDRLVEGLHDGCGEGERPGARVDDGVDDEQAEEADDEGRDEAEGCHAQEQPGDGAVVVDEGHAPISRTRCPGRAEAGRTS